MVNNLFSTSMPVRESSVIYYESVGKRDKFWFDDANQQRCMFKQNLIRGEDWPEVLVCEIADILGLPHAVYGFAHLVDDNDVVMASGEGVVTASFVEPEQSLMLGNTLLSEINADYSAQGNNYQIKTHTIDAISQAIERLESPLGVAQHTGLSALDFYAGYLFLDVLVANQDRHHENWGCIQSANRHYLAPTFDHASSLARNVSDAEKQKRMESRDRGFIVEAFANRARSAININGERRRTLTTRDALKAFCDFNDIGVAVWQERLRNLSADQLSAIINRVPECYMSDITRRFTLCLLNVNKNYLLDL